jgi:hypothetical protein
MSNLLAVFEHTVRLGKIESTPAKGVRRLANTPRDRRLSGADIEKLGRAMRTRSRTGNTRPASPRFVSSG